MVADGGVVRARLILDSSQFGQALNKEVTTAERALLGSNINPQLQAIAANTEKASSGFGRATQPVRNYSNALNDTNRNTAQLSKNLVDAKSSFVGYRSAIEGNAVSMAKYNALSKDYYGNLTKNFYEMRNGIKTVDSYSNSVKNLGNTSQYAYGRLSGMDLAINTARSSMGSLGNIDLPLRSATDRMVSKFGSGINTMVSYTASGVKQIGNYFSSGLGASDYISAIMGGVISGQVFNYAQQRATTKQLLLSKPMQPGSTGSEMYQQYQQYTVRSSTSDEMINRIFQFVMNSKTPSNRTEEAISSINAAGYSADPVQRNRDVLAYGAFLQGGWDQAGRMLKDEGLTDEQKDQFKGADTFDERLKALQDLAKSRGQMDAFGNDISTQMTGPLGNYNKVLAASDNLMKALANAFENLLGVIAPVADWFNNLDDSQRNFIGTAVLFAGSIAIGISSLKILGSIISPNISLIKNLGSAFLEYGAKQAVAANGAKAVSVANSAIASSGPGAIASLQGIGTALKGFLLNPVTLAVIGIGALIAVLAVAADKYHWFQDGISQSNDALTHMKLRIDETKTAQTNAQKEVDKWQNAVKNSKKGTVEYTNAENNLTQAKKNLAKATAAATIAQDSYSAGEKTTASLTAILAAAQQDLAEATIKYRVAVGELTPEQGKVLAQGAQGAADELTPAQQKIRNQTDTVIAQTNRLKESTEIAPKDQPKLGYIAQTSYETTTGKGFNLLDPNTWGKFNPNFSLLSPVFPNLFGNGLPNLNIGKNVGDLSNIFSGIASNPLQMLGGLFSPVSAGTPTGQPGATKPSDATSVQSAINPNAMQWPTTQDILNAVGLGNFQFPQFTWPTLTDIQGWLGLGSFTLPTFQFPTLTDIQGWLNIPGFPQWHIPSWNDITGAMGVLKFPNWHIPTWTDISNAMHIIKFPSWPKIPDIGAIISSKIPSFHWPWGPSTAVTKSVQSVGSGSNNGGGGAWGPPRGPLTTSLTSILSNKSGVARGYVQQALSANSASSRFNPIANSLSDHLSYSFYMGDQKSNSEVWNSGTCNCYDGAQLLEQEAAARFGLSTGMGHGVWNGTDIPHAWSVIGGIPYDMAAKLLRGYWHPPSGPQQNVAQFMQDIGPGLEYIGYGGHKYDPVSSLMSGGNCFDMSLGLLQTANDLYGANGQLVWGNWDGVSHVWTRFGSTDYDPARRALNGTWSPPPQGPSRVSGNYSGSNQTIKKISLEVNVSLEGAQINGIKDAENTLQQIADQTFDKKIEEYFEGI